MAKNKGGRPSKKDLIDLDMLKLLCKKGATDIELAKAFKVSRATISNYKKDPKFLDALKDGKDEANKNVESSLFKLANGHVTKINKAFKVKKIEYYEGKKVKETEEIIYAEDEVFTPPNVTAQIFWLKNRDQQRWRDKTDVDLNIKDLADALESAKNRAKKDKS